MQGLNESQESEGPQAWPPTNLQSRLPARDLTTDTSAALASDRVTVMLLRQLASGGAYLTRQVCWTTTYGDDAEALEAYRALLDQGERLELLATGALAFGRKWFDRLLEEAVQIRREDEARMLAEAAEASEEARLEEEKARQINAFYRDHGHRKQLSLERRSGTSPLWTIDFAETWERERFWDWLKWQTGRFEEFMAMLEDVSRFDLEKLLLAEMLRTEAAVKKQGLGAGGRRPLRFWRG